MSNSYAFQDVNVLPDISGFLGLPIPGSGKQTGTGTRDSSAGEKKDQFNMLHGDAMWYEGQKMAIQDNYDKGMQDLYEKWQSGEHGSDITEFIQSFQGEIGSLISTAEQAKIGLNTMRGTLEQRYKQATEGMNNQEIANLNAKKMVHDTRGKIIDIGDGLSVVLSGWQVLAPVSDTNVDWVPIELSDSNVSVHDGLQTINFTGDPSIALPTGYAADSYKETLTSFVNANYNAAISTGDRTERIRSDHDIRTTHAGKVSTNINALISSIRNSPGLLTSGDRGGLLNEALNKAKTYTIKDNQGNEFNVTGIPIYDVSVKFLTEKNEYTTDPIDHRDPTGNTRRGPDDMRIVYEPVMDPETGMLQVINPRFNPEEAIDELAKQYALNLAAGKENIAVDIIDEHTPLTTRTAQDRHVDHFLAEVALDKRAFRAGAQVALMTGDFENVDITQALTNIGLEALAEKRAVSMAKAFNAFAAEHAEEYNRGIRLANEGSAKERDAFVERFIRENPDSFGEDSEWIIPQDREAERLAKKRMTIGGVAVGIASMNPIVRSVALIGAFINHVRSDTGEDVSVNLSMLDKKETMFHILTGQAIEYRNTPPHVRKEINDFYESGYSGLVKITGSNIKSANEISSQGVYYDTGERTYQQVAFMNPQTGQIEPHLAQEVYMYLTKDELKEMQIEIIKSNGELDKGSYYKYGPYDRKSGTPIERIFNETTRGRLTERYGDQAVVYRVPAMIALTDWDNKIKYSQTKGQNALQESVSQDIQERAAESEAMRQGGVEVYTSER